MRGRVLVLGLIALVSSIFMINLVLNLETNTRIYGSTYELDKEKIDYFLFDNPNNLSLKAYLTSPNTLYGNKYYSLCWKGNESVLHEVEFNTDFSEIINTQESFLPFLDEYFPTYHLASDGSCFWTLDLDFNLISFTKNELLNVSLINVNYAMMDYIFPIFGLRYWDENLYIYGTNATETDSVFHIGRLNLETLDYDFILEEDKILPKEYSTFHLRNGFDIDDRGNLWIASDLRKPTEKGLQYIKSEIYTYNMTSCDISSRIKYSDFGKWIPEENFEEKWIDRFTSIFSYYDTGSMSIERNHNRIIIPFTASIYNNEEWQYGFFAGLLLFSFYNSPFPWIEVVIWGGGIFIPVITISILILNSKMKFGKIEN